MADETKQNNNADIAEQLRLIQEQLKAQQPAPQKKKGFFDDIFGLDDAPKELTGATILKPGKPIVEQGLPKYPVYLIFDNEETKHTSIIKFKDKNKNYWYYLDWNKKIYSKDEVEFGRELYTQACNFIFLEGEKLVLGEGEFSPKAQEEIDAIDRMKLEDRAYEKSNARMNRKYKKIEGINIIVAILILCVGVFLVLWVVFGGLPPVINSINNVVVVPAAEVAQNVSNQSFVVGG